MAGPRREKKKKEGKEGWEKDPQPNPIIRQQANINRGGGKDSLVQKTTAHPAERNAKLRRGGGGERLKRGDAHKFKGGKRKGGKSGCKYIWMRGSERGLPRGQLELAPTGPVRMAGKIGKGPCNLYEPGSW